MSNILFKPVKIGNVEFRNRIIFPSMCLFYCDNEGYINDRYTAFVMERVKGGIGGIVIPGSPYGKVSHGRPALLDDCYMPGWQKLGERIHEYGVKFVCQLHPVPFSPPVVKHPNNPSEYPEEFIEEIIASFVATAVRAQNTGVDCVEIHGAHGHELAMFTSPHYNSRTDKYGKNYTGRSRFGCDIIREIKKACGKDFPVIYRINGEDKLEDGLMIEETVKIAELLEEAGADAIHVSGGLPPKEYFASASMDFEDCLFADDAAKVKKNISIPVIAVGRIVDVEQAREIVESGKADMVAMGRALLADSELINKAAGRNSFPVRRCIGCNQGCRDAKRYLSIQCMQNPSVGKENDLMLLKTLDKTNSPKVMIVGAGPAGLEAAVTLVQYGIKPEIYDQNKEPGGLINLSKVVPHKQNLDSLTKYRKSLLDHYEVEIHCETEVTKELIMNKNPDILILATGSDPLIPTVHGIDISKALSGDDVLRQNGVEGNHIAVIGGGLVGCEIAEFLRAQGKEVDVFEMQDEIAAEMYIWKREVLVDRMKDSGILLHESSRVVEIALPDITIDKNGAKILCNGFDNIVFTVGRKPNRKLAQQLEGLPMRIYEAGDMKSPQFALDAVRDGYEIAKEILLS